MKVTEVIVTLMEEKQGGGDRLRAFANVLLEGELGRIVVRDLKIIESNRPGKLFLAMPSRKLTDHCPKCRGKNHFQARFCNDCGVKLDAERATRDDEERVKLHADVVHPIDNDTRDRLSEAVLKAYWAKVQERQRQAA